MCLYPKLIRNPKYKPNKKNGGKPPFAYDIRVMWVPIGCGECMECMKKKAREWQIRLQEEIRENKNGKFITLTFNDESLEELKKVLISNGETMPEKWENEVARIATRRFLERWRKKYKKSIRHWMCTELGHTGTERIHMHGILWTDEPKEIIEKIWNYGMIWQGSFVNEKTINYIVKYIHKMDNDHIGYKPKVLCSPGIGGNYTNRKDSSLNKYSETKETDESYKLRNGSKSSLPIYYRNKIYTEEEREKLWIEKIDRGIRYVNKEKIDMSQKGAQKIYNNILKYNQKLNKKLGYGEGKGWNLKKYEESLKNINKRKDIEE